ncbi:MAG: hypothetical protein Fur0041_00420 [Bacteroidia bacterium]
MNKRVIIAAVAVAMAFVLAPGKALAQKYQGQMNVTAGASFSLTGLFINTIMNGVDNVTGVSTRSTPGLNGMLDYGVTDRFSIGAAYHYQSFRADFTSYTNDSGVVMNGDWYASITRQNIGLRTLFHFGDNDDLDTYAGARFGYTFWSAKTNATGSGIDKNTATSRLWPQALFGMRYFFTPNIGVNVEFSVGPPYYMMFGLNARFGGGGA